MIGIRAPHETGWLRPLPLDCGVLELLQRIGSPGAATPPKSQQGGGVEIWAKKARH